MGNNQIISCRACSRQFHARDKANLHKVNKFYVCLSCANGTNIDMVQEENVSYSTNEAAKKINRMSTIVQLWTFDKPLQLFDYDWTYSQGGQWNSPKYQGLSNLPKIFKSIDSNMYNIHKSTLFISNSNIDSLCNMHSRMTGILAGLEKHFVGNYEQTIAIFGRDFSNNTLSYNNIIDTGTRYLDNELNGIVKLHHSQYDKLWLYLDITTNSLVLNMCNFTNDKQFLQVIKFMHKMIVLINTNKTYKDAYISSLLLKAYLKHFNINPKV